MSERQLHLEVVRLLRRAGILFLHPANGGKRLKSEAFMLSLMGLQAGVPDLLVLSPLPRRSTVRGVAIELKSPTGRVSPEQDRWMRALRSAGWIAVVCRSVEDVETLLAEVGLVERKPAPSPVPHGLDGAEAPHATPEID